LGEARACACRPHPLEDELGATLDGVVVHLLQPLRRHVAAEDYLGHVQPEAGRARGEVLVDADHVKLLGRLLELLERAH